MFINDRLGRRQGRQLTGAVVQFRMSYLPLSLLDFSGPVKAGRRPFSDFVVAEFWLQTELGAVLALLTATHHARDVSNGLRSAQQCCRLGRFFDAFSHFLASLEVRGVFRGNGHGFTALGIPTFPCWPVIHAKTSEAANFDAITMNQRISNSVEDFLDRNFGILGRQMAETGGECGDEV